MMELKKRVAAIAALCIMLLVVLPSGQRQQVAAMSEFCRCFNDCYPGCRSPGVPRWLCIPFCANKCSPSSNQQAGDGVVGNATATCRMACKIHICDSSEAPAGAADADVCVQNCNKFWSHKAHN